MATVTPPSPPLSDLQRALKWVAFLKKGWVKWIIGILVIILIVSSIFPRSTGSSSTKKSAGNSVFSGKQFQKEITSLAPVPVCGLEEGRYTLKVIDIPISFLKIGNVEETIPTIVGRKADPAKLVNLPRQDRGHFNAFINKAADEETIIIGSTKCATLSWNITREERQLFESGQWKLEPTIIQFGLRKQFL